MRVLLSIGAAIGLVLQTMPAHAYTFSPADTSFRLKGDMTLSFTDGPSVKCKVLMKGRTEKGTQQSQQSRILGSFEFGVGYAA